MKIIIAGGRDINLDFDTMDGLIRLLVPTPNLITEVVCGMSQGIDTSGQEWANCSANKVQPFPADWDNLGLAAGPIRNRQMAQYADALLLIWSGTSRGSANMKAEMLKLNKPIYEVLLGTYNTTTQNDDPWK